MSTHVTLDMRGTRQSVERDKLMELPESVLLCLFPNGVVLSPPIRSGLDADHEDTYLVDFDGACLDFVLSFFDKARLDFYGTPENPRVLPTDATQQGNLANPLFLKQAIIVLREELEYFSIPPKTAPDGRQVPKTDDNGLANEELALLKRSCGDALLKRKSIFTALQRNVNRENNVAEQHLIDMLCMSGFEREDEWGYRALEPGRCSIASIALVLLKTGITHSSSPSSADNSNDDSITAANNNNSSTDAPGESEESQEKVAPGIQVNAQQLATAQKLLLFWRKPARKCWWDATEVKLDEGTASEREVKVWARRVWTLELSLI